MDQQQNNTPNMREQTMLMAILAYIGPLVIVSYFFSKDDPFVKFHAKQGLVLFIIDIAVWILSGFFWPLWALFQIINLIIFILVIIGVVNVIQKKERELPIVGHLAKYFTF